MYLRAFGEDLSFEPADEGIVRISIGYESYYRQGDVFFEKNILLCGKDKNLFYAGKKNIHFSG